MTNVRNEWKYAFYLIVHPFKGFWEIKREQRGSVCTGLLILALFTLTKVANGLYNGYLFNPDNGIHFNVFKSICVTLAVFLLWCVSNWCLTCLFDGEGGFSDIVRATGYALLPMVFVQILLIPITNFLSLREAAFVSFLYGIGYIWSGFLLFASVLVTHQYSFFKTLVMIVCVLLGMCAQAYIALLFFNLFQQMAGFIYVLYTEFVSNF